jgi:2-C-methyl-D-erythritol 4-phosphate cytidylyltransferase
VVENVDAGNLWATATPQAFKYEIVVKALEAAQKKRKTLQDESEAMALIKQEVRIVPTTKPTLKIVVPSDIHTAEWLLRR